MKATMGARSRRTCWSGSCAFLKKATLWTSDPGGSYLAWKETSGGRLRIKVRRAGASVTRAKERRREEKATEAEAATATDSGRGSGGEKISMMLAGVMSAVGTEIGGAEMQRAKEVHERPVKETHQKCLKDLGEEGSGTLNGTGSQRLLRWEVKKERHSWLSVLGGKERSGVNATRSQSKEVSVMHVGKIEKSITAENAVYG